MKQLTESQIKHKDAVKWLLGPTVGNGKTYLICVAALEVAAENLGVWIHLFDHVQIDSNVQIKRMIGMVQQLYAEGYSETHKLTIKGDTFKLDLKKPV